MTDRERAAVADFSFESFRYHARDDLGVQLLHVAVSLADRLCRDDVVLIMRLFANALGDTRHITGHRTGFSGNRIARFVDGYRHAIIIQATRFTRGWSNVAGERNTEVDLPEGPQRD